MKYEVDDIVSSGNPGYEHEFVVVHAQPPQPTYNLKDTKTGTIHYHFEENGLTLVKKRPLPCKHLIMRFDRMYELVAFNDFCPLCGEDLRPLREK